MQNRLLSIKRAAKALNVSTSTVRRLIDKEYLNSTRIGGRIKISNTEIERYLGSNSPPPVAPAYTQFSVKHISFFQKLLRLAKTPHIKYTIPTLNSMEAETLETFITEDINAEEIFAFLKESNHEILLQLLSHIMNEKNLDIKKSLILLFTEEAILNLQRKKELLNDVIEGDKTMLILPVPPHVVFNVIEFIPKGQIINTDGRIPPHLENIQEFIRDIKEIDPIELHRQFLKTKVLIMDGMKSSDGIFIRRNIAYLVTQFLYRIEKIYLHFIPHIPKDQSFTLLSDKKFLTKVIQL